MDQDAAQFPSVGCCTGAEVVPGRYAFPAWFDIPLAIDVPSGWRVLNEPGAGLFMLGRGENELGTPNEIVLFLDATDAGTGQQLIDGILNVPQLAGGEASPLSLADFDGWQGGTNALSNPEFEGDPAADIPAGVQPLPSIERFLTEGFTWTTSTPEAELFLSTVDVVDRRLLIYLEAPPGDMDAFAADAIPMLESLSTSDEP